MRRMQMHAARNVLQAAMGQLELGQKDKVLSSLKTLNALIGPTRPMETGEPRAYTLDEGRDLLLEPVDGGILMVLSNSASRVYASLPTALAYDIGDDLSHLAEDNAEPLAWMAARGNTLKTLRLVAKRKGASNA